MYFVNKTAVVNGIRDSDILDRNETSLSEQNTAYYKPNSEQNLLKSRYERGEIIFDIYMQEWNKLKIKHL